MQKPIYVIGHRNPDTDSICSAVGYAHLKQQLGDKVIPARAGRINPETKFVLEYFGIEAPILITDLYPRVKDVMTAVPPAVRPDNTLRELGKIMRQHNLKSVPVTEDDNILAGIVTVGDLAKRYFNELEMQDLAQSGVTYSALLRTLNGELLLGENLERTVTGQVRIAASRTQTLAERLTAGDVVVVGDRGKSQLACIQGGVACLVITGGHDLSPAARDAASVRDVIVIRVPHNTYTTARLINQSVPVRLIMQSEVVAFKPSDLIADIKNTIVGTKFRNYPVVEQGRLVGIINRDRLIVPEREKVILVDHNERGQAVEGIEEAQIIEIIDHHRLGGLETGEPIFIRHEPVGSTATIVANMHWHRNIAIPPRIAGLLLAAVISDTVLFKSPTSTPKDRETAEKLAAVAGLDLRDFGMAVLKAGSAMGDMAPADIIKNDLKEFQIGEYHVAIGQIAVMDPSDILARAKEIQSYMEVMRLKENYDIVMLMVTDVDKESTHLIYEGQETSLVELAFGRRGQDGTVFLPGVMSRKKQVVPPMAEAARQIK